MTEQEATDIADQLISKLEIAQQEYNTVCTDLEPLLSRHYHPEKPETRSCSNPPCHTRESPHEKVAQHLPRHQPTYGLYNIASG